MWERAAYLAFFVDLCLAQRGAIADLRARHEPAPNAAPVMIVDSFPASDPSLPTPLIQSEIMNPSVIRSLAPASSIMGEVVNNLELRSPQDSVFVTVLYPSVPTAAPTGVMVPTEVTYTGTFNPNDVDLTGYVYSTPTDAAQTAAGTSQTNPTTAHVTHKTSQTMSTLKTQSHSTQASTSRSHTPSKMHTSSRTSSTSHSSVTSSSTSKSSSTSSASAVSSSNLNNTQAGAAPDRNPHLSSGAIAGVVVGVVGGIGALAAGLLYLLKRRQRPKAPDSPGIYPQEAYLYDPPITPPGDGPRGLPGAAADLPRAGTPEMAATENSGLLAGAAAAGAIGAAAAAGGARSRRGTAGDEQRPGFNGYSPVETRDTSEAGGNPFNDPVHEINGESSRWPLNPNAPSGLGTPPGTSSGPSVSQPYRDSPPQGPQIAGVGSQRYDRRISSGNLSVMNRSSPNLPEALAIGNRSTGNLSGSGTPPQGYNPAMREARRAFGMDE